MQDAFSELTEAGATDSVVKATLGLSESGFMGIQDAYAFSDIKKDDGSIQGESK